MAARLRALGLGNVARFTYRLAGVAIRHPREAADHLATQIALTRSTAAEPLPIATDPDWLPHLHERLHAPWPCEEHAGFDDVWTALESEAAADAALGRAHDSDPTLARAVWCAVRHAKPQAVVETGVSRGVTSRAILEAMELNGVGRLWSIDLPPLEEPWRRLVGSAVPERLRPRWTYVRGASSRHLEHVCRGLGAVDLFVHDSLHTPANLAFEVRTVAPFLASGAPIVVDDAEDCRAAEVLSPFVDGPLIGVRGELKSGAVGIGFR
jgi:hypothetical protein